MNKQKVFSMLDQHKRLLNQVNGLSSVLENAGGLTNHSDNDLSACMGILSDLTNDLKANYEIISQSVIQLGIVNDCVQGNGSKAA